MKLVFRIVRSAIYIPLFLWFFGWLLLQSRVYDIHLPVPGEWSRPTGIILMIIGSMLILYCIAIFIIHGKGTPAVFDAPTEFVATGPYKYVRNPMYIGLFMFLFGFSLYYYSVAMVLATLLVILFFHLFVIFYEEPILAKQFGKSYLDYKRQVRRWLPGKK